MNEQERQNRIVASRAGRKAVAEGRPTAWFEPLYEQAAAADDPARVPWVDLEPNRQLVAWLDRESPTPGRVLVVGCGLGDDAEELSRRGFKVTAFDLSQTAVQWCRERYPDSAVVYEAADLLDPPQSWRGGFEFVVEIYTVQSLPLSMRDETIRTVKQLVAPRGCLLVIARGRPDEDTDPMGPPWPLSPQEMAAFGGDGFTVERLEQYGDPDDEDVLRMRGLYRRREER